MGRPAPLTTATDSIAACRAEGGTRSALQGIVHHGGVARVEQQWLVGQVEPQKVAQLRELGSGAGFG